MMTTCPVTKMDTYSSSIKLPRRLCTSPIDTIQFGVKLLPCHIIPSDEEECQINVDLWDTLLLPDQSLFRLHVSDSNLRILPLIGCFTTAIQWGTQQPLGKETTFQEKWLTQTQKQGGVAYFFTGHSINWDEGTVRGLLFLNNRWSEHVFPLPDVIYDRIPNRRAEHSASVALIKDTLQTNYLIPWFNPGFFDKWEIFELLKDDPLAKTYLPETTPFSKVDLFHLLRIFKCVYLKPSNKSKGSGIIRALLTEDGSYDVQVRNERSSPSYSFDEPLSFWQFIKRITQHTSYILQRGITCIEYNDQAVDFRIHTNKDKNSEWQISAFAAKCSGPQQITTHFAYGGQVLPVEKLISQPELRNDMITKLKQAVLWLSHSLDQKMEDLLGELGFDLGYDQNGDVWLFEINSKPRHHIFLDPSIRQQLDVVHHYWFDYCESLSLA